MFEYKEIYLAGGCFWGLQKYFDNVCGVVKTEVGYANGDTENPSYQDVCQNESGHAETVKVIYNPTLLSFSKLLDLYYDVIDPTSLNRQGGDLGVQYRTGVYYLDKADLALILESITKLQIEYEKPIAIEVKPLENYYPAEEYHQKYLDKNPLGYCHIGAEKFAKAKLANSPVYQIKSQDELKNTLTEMQYNVTQHDATEPPFHNQYFNNFKVGIYVDITTGEPLFISTDKFDSGCGWPSFSKPIDKKRIIELPDNSRGRQRIEVRSSLSDAHLGHVFNDGPTETGGLRYCINSASLRFIEKENLKAEGYAELEKLF